MASASRFLCGVASILFFAACAETKVKEFWKDEYYHGPRFANVLVLGVVKEPPYRRALEDQLVRALERAKVEAHAGHRIFPGDERVDEGTALGEARARGIDAVLVARLIDTRSDRIFPPGEKQIRPYPAPYLGRGWYGFYASSYRVMETPGYETEHALVAIETEIYPVGADQPIWSALTRTVEKDPNAAIESYVRALGGPLRTSDLF